MQPGIASRDDGGDAGADELDGAGHATALFSVLTPVRIRRNWRLTAISIRESSSLLGLSDVSGPPPRAPSPVSRLVGVLDGGGRPLVRLGKGGAHTYKARHSHLALLVPQGGHVATADKCRVGRLISRWGCD